MKILRVGDPHIRPANIEEAEALMHFIKHLVITLKIDRLELLGDLFHTHSIIRLEVLEFWNGWLQVFSDIVETVILVGNHDQSGDYRSTFHALRVFKNMMAHRPFLKIVDVPVVYGVYGYMPYIHDIKEFVTQAKSLKEQGANILVCHATFYGSQFDNGFYAPEGINPDDIPFDQIISGHIHKEQMFANGKVDYPGTAKWDTQSDANENKGVWLYEHDDKGKVLVRQMIPTDKVCRPIVSLTWKEGEEMPVFPENAKASIELIGSSTWITKQKASLKGTVGLRSKVTDKKETAKRTVGKGFDDFLLNTYSSTVAPQELYDYAKELGIV